jgi:hypothetical protein
MVETINGYEETRREEERMVQSSYCGATYAAPTGAHLLVGVTFRLAHIATAPQVIGARKHPRHSASGRWEEFGAGEAATKLIDSALKLQVRRCDNFVQLDITARCRLCSC